MSAINLLPWREAIRLKQNRMFYTLLFATVFLTLGTSYCCTIFVDQMIAKQQGRHQFLQSEILKLNSEITKISLQKKNRKKLIKQIDLIQHLQRKRNHATALFNTLTEVVSSDVYLNSVSLSGGNLDIKGVATTNRLLATIVKRLNGVSWLQDAYIRSIFSNNSKSAHLNKFEIQATVRVPLGVEK